MTHFGINERIFTRKIEICSNCGNICPLMHISQYKSKKCPKCKNLITQLV